MFTEIILDDFKKCEILHALLVQTNFFDGCIVNIECGRGFADCNRHHFVSRQ